MEPQDTTTAGKTPFPQPLIYLMEEIKRSCRDMPTDEFMHHIVGGFDPQQPYAKVIELSNGDWALKSLEGDDLDIPDIPAPRELSDEFSANAIRHLFSVGSVDYSEEQYQSGASELIRHMDTSADDERVCSCGERIPATTGDMKLAKAEHMLRKAFQTMRETR